MATNASRITPLWCVSVCTGISAACTPLEDDRTAGHTVSDSAGIEIVANQAASWSPDEQWRVSETPTRTIGEVEGPAELLFGRVTAVGWLGDGRIFVGDDQAHALRIFSADGVYLETVGREGEGPGEFQWFWNVESYRGDSLYVYDYGLRVAHIFGPDLSFVRRVRNPVIQGNYWVRGALADGRFLLYSPGVLRLSGGPGILPDTSQIITTSPAGTDVDTVGVFEVSLRNIGSDGRAGGLHLQPHGSLVAAGDRIKWTEGHHFEYTEATSDGTVRRIVRKEHRPVAVTGSIIAEFKAQYLRFVDPGGAGASDRLRRSLEEAEYYHQLPATSEIEVDALGMTWVGHYHFTGVPATEWEVFDTTGVWLGSVHTPPGLEVHVIGRDQIIGVMKDALGVPFVQVYHLDRP